jgi:hypothetical protein
MILGLLNACKPEIEEFKPANGNADFSTYIAVGNSLIAGYADGALYLSGQEYSLPNILAGQFKQVGGGEFKQPLMADENGIGFRGATPVTKLVLGYPTDCLGTVSLGAVPASNEVNMANLAPVGDQGPFNNLGIPGAKAIHMVVPGYGALNPFYGRMASAPGNAVIDEIPAVNATFFTIWLGNNDILTYALAGGEADAITPVEVFEQAYLAILNTLQANGAKGVLINFPNSLTTPFFTTVPYNVLVLSQEQADQLNAGYAILNQIIVGAGSTDTIHFSAGPNPLVIADDVMPWGLRQIKHDELVLLSIPQDSLKCAGWGSQVPVPASYVLDQVEIGEVTTAVSAYNAKILEIALSNSTGLLDAYAVMQEAHTTGFVYDGIEFNGDFVSGNLHSLDGIHLTPAGNAVFANFLIDAINKQFGANIPKVVVSDYAAIVYPDI